MSPGEVLGAAFLLVGALLELVASVGVLVAKTTYDRLHFASLGAVAATPLVAIGVMIERGVSADSLKVGLVALFVVGASPILTHVTARAVHVRGGER